MIQQQILRSGRSKIDGSLFTAPGYCVPGLLSGKAEVAAFAQKQINFIAGCRYQREREQIASDLRALVIAAAMNRAERDKVDRNIPLDRLGRQHATEHPALRVRRTVAEFRYLARFAEHS